MPPGRTILYIIGTVVILFAAYFVTYYIGRKASGQTYGARTRNRNITMLDRFAFSRDKFFCVVEIAGKVYIVGVTNNSMTILDTYDAGVYEQLVSAGDAGTPMPWADTPVGRYGNKLTKKVVAFVASKTGKKESFAESMRKASADASASVDVSASAEADTSAHRDSEDVN